MKKVRKRSDDSSILLNKFELISQKPMNSLNFYFLRHGEITHTDHLAGHTDYELSMTGRTDLINKARSLEWDRVITSPLVRCWDVAQQIASEKVCDIQIEDAIKEYNFGDWDGQSFESLWAMPKPNIGDFWQDPFALTPPNGESMLDFKERVGDWWREQLSQPKEESILVISHAGVIKEIAGLVLGLPSNHNIHSHLSLRYASHIHVQVSFDQHHAPWAALKNLSCYLHVSRDNSRPEVYNDDIA